LVIVLGFKKIKLDIYIIKLELLKYIISIVISISNWILMAMSMINWSNLYMIMIIMFSVSFDILICSFSYSFNLIVLIINNIFTF
jgi:hypothetical protein